MITLYSIRHGEIVVKRERKYGKMTELRRLSIDDGMDIYRMLQDIPKEENGLLNSANGLTFAEYKEWLKGRYAGSEQIGIVDGWKVPSTTFWLYVDDTPVGFGNVRHFLTDALRKAGGHIGYGIAPQYRGKGYGKKILELLLKEADRLGIDKALVTIHLDNPASKAVALANGGVITGQTDERLLIWVDTAQKDKSIFDQVEKNIDNLVTESVDWTACATKEQLQAAREGKLTLRFFDRNVPEEWLKDIKGKKVLCLAGAGGLQAPLLACAGAEVTVIDISNKMLDKDREIAKNENLQIEIVKGNMCDLSMFDECYFDYIINPPSLMYIPNLRVVFRECYRVLNKGGIFIMMAPNPINYVCDYIDDENGGYYKAVHRMPFCSKDYDDSDWIEYGHTMEEYLGGLIECGFLINGYVECQMDDITELQFMTRAVKN